MVTAQRGADPCERADVAWVGGRPWGRRRRPAWRWRSRPACPCLGRRARPARACRQRPRPPGRAHRSRKQRRRRRPRRERRPPRPAHSRSPVAAMNSFSGGSRLRAPTRTVSSGETVPESSSMRSGMPHGFPLGDVSGVFRSPCASNQTTPSRSVARREALDGADVRAAAAAEDDGRSGSEAAQSEVLLGERVLLDDRQPRGRARAKTPLRPSLPRLRPTRAARAQARLGNARPHEWHSYSPPASATAVSVWQSGQRARMRSATAGRKSDSVRQARRSPRRGRRRQARRGLQLRGGARPGDHSLRDEPVDPGGLQPGAGGWLDAVEEARRDVHVETPRSAPVSCEELLPVAGSGLVGARLRRRDPRVDRHSDPLERGVEQVGVGVREDRELKAAAAQLGERSRAPRGRAARSARTRPGRTRPQRKAAAPRRRPGARRACLVTSLYGRAPWSWTRGSISW